MASNGRLVGLFKQGLNEIPEVMFAGVGALVAIALASGKIYYNVKNNKENKEYKMYPTYMRPDDPRTVKVHKP